MKLILIQLIGFGFQAVELIILAGVILSWIAVASPRPRWMYHPLVRWLEDTSFALVRPFRRLLDRIGLRTGPIDFSPMIALLVLYFLANLLQNLVWRLPIP